MHLRVAVPIYPKVDLIDVSAPVDLLSRVNSYWKPNTLEYCLVADALKPVMTGQQVQILPDATFSHAGDFDVLLVPGARDVSAALENTQLTDFLVSQAANAQWVASVCTGSVILGNAGLLDGYQATTHWAALPQLQKMQGVKVVNGYPRVVVDRNRLTTGGVSSSIDGTLTLISLLTNEQVAKCTQLIVQYHPQPPFDCGDPATADYTTYTMVANA